MLAKASSRSWVQFVSMGLLGELVAWTYYESQGKRAYAVRRLAGGAGEGWRSGEESGPSLGMHMKVDSHGA